MSESLSEFRGTGQFGPAYQWMLERDSHADGSVDRILMDRMVRVCEETVPFLYPAHDAPTCAYRHGTRPALEHIVDSFAGDLRGGRSPIDCIADWCVALAEKAPEGMDAIVLGGREEAIIARRSDWCTDLARVACALCQVAGVPSRIVYLFDLGSAYSGHAIIEAYTEGAWGAVDSTVGVAYRHSDGGPAGTWDLMRDGRLVAAHAGDDRPFTRPAQFSGAAIAEYAIADADSYDYTESGVNDYYRSILDMSFAGWPGGLRWLHGEDGADMQRGRDTRGKG